MKVKSLKQVALSDTTNKKLDEISQHRKSEDNLCWRKRDIVATLIDTLHKKEVK